MGICYTVVKITQFVNSRCEYTFYYSHNESIMRIVTSVLILIPL